MLISKVMQSLKRIIAYNYGTTHHAKCSRNFIAPRLCLPTTVQASILNWLRNLGHFFLSDGVVSGVASISYGSYFPTPPWFSYATVWDQCRNVVIRNWWEPSMSWNSAWLQHVQGFQRCSVAQAIDRWLHSLRACVKYERKQFEQFLRCVVLKLSTRNAFQRSNYNDQITVVMSTLEFVTFHKVLQKHPSAGHSGVVLLDIYLGIS